MRNIAVEDSRYEIYGQFKDVDLYKLVKTILNDDFNNNSIADKIKQINFKCNENNEYNIIKPSAISELYYNGDNHIIQVEYRLSGRHDINLLGVYNPNNTTNTLIILTTFVQPKVFNPECTIY